jgi:hypothetical protein
MVYAGCVVWPVKVTPFIGATCAVLAGVVWAVVVGTVAKRFG